MPLPSSGTINLSDVIEEFGIGSNNSANVFTTAGAGTVTAPVTGFVIVEVLGAGGGGGGSDTGGVTGGGGGSGAYAKELIYINAGETLDYYVGLYGDFGEGPGGPTNGQPGENSYVTSNSKSITTIVCGGGGGGETGVSVDGTGGSGGSDTYANTSVGIAYMGNSGFDGNLGGGGGTSPEGISGAPAAGNGGEGSINAGNGSNGINGAVKFTWYETTKNLRGYLKSANTNVPDFTTNSAVPTSGTMELRDFLGGSALGFKSTEQDIEADCGSTGLSNSGRVMLKVHANGRYDLDATVIVAGSGFSVTEALDQQWCTANGNGAFEPRRFYVALFPYPGIDSLEAGSFSTNTYISLSSGWSPNWNLFSSASDQFLKANLCISSNNSNSGLIAWSNVSFSVLAAGAN
jgi:hypothetical protein